MRAVWNGQYYDPGETLDPECAPTDANCDVNPVTDPAHGGTGLTSYAAGDLLYATSSSALGRLALGVDGKVLKVVGGTLAWSDDTAGTAFTADGNGIELSGSAFGLELDGATLSKSSDGLRISPTYAGQDTITTLGTVTTGTWNGAAIGDAYLTKSGDWTGTLDSYEAASLLDRTNHTGTQTADTIADFSTAVENLMSATDGLTVSGTQFGLVLDGGTLTASPTGLKISDTYIGQTTIAELGTVTKGTWNANVIGDAYIDKSGDWTGTLDSYEAASLLDRTNHTGTQTADTIADFSTAVENLMSATDGLTVSGTQYGLVLDGATLEKSLSGLRLSVTYPGQSSITTLGTISSGTWNGTAIGDAYLTKSGNWTGTFDGIEGAAYAILAGQAGGQTLRGGTAASETLTLQSTSNATKGKILFGISGYDEANNRLGIGTSSPSAALHLVKTTEQLRLGYDATNYFSFTVGSANGLTVTPAVAATNGINFTKTDGTTSILDIDTSNARVGIGNSAPTHKLDIVAGALATTQRALSLTGTLSATAARQVGIQGAFTTSAGNTNENDGLFIQLLAGNVSSAFNIAGMFANTTAGTGTSVVGGTANYGVYGDVNSTTAGTNLGVYGQSAGGAISIGLGGNSVTAKDSATNIGVLGLGRNTGASSKELGGYFGLATTTPTFASAALMADNGSTTSPIFVARDAGTEVFRIDDGGKVGIGIASPQQLLDVSSTQPVLRITNTTNLSGVAWAASEIARVEFYNTDASQPSVAANISVIGSADSSGGLAAGDLAFFTKNSAGSLTEKVRITDLGGVGIGTSTPGSYALRLVATRQAASGDLAVASLENAGTSSADVLALKQTGEAGSAESTFVNFFTNAGAIGNIASNGSGVVSYNATSDRRLKDDIAETQYGIDDVLKISVREYTMRQDPKKLKQTGFIAQELAAIYPDAVSANGDDGLSPLDGKTPWSIDYGRLTPLLVKSVQDQQLLLGDIAAKDGLSELTAQARGEDPISAFDYISGKIRDGWRPLMNFAVLRVTALRAYVDEIFARRTHQEELCVGTPGNETCLNKADIDTLLNSRAVPSQSQAAPPPPSDAAPPAADEILPTPSAE